MVQVCKAVTLVFTSLVCIHNAHTNHYEHCSMIILCSSANVLCPDKHDRYHLSLVLLWEVYPMLYLEWGIYHLFFIFYFLFCGCHCPECVQNWCGSSFAFVFKQNFVHAVSLLILSNNAIYYDSAMIRMESIFQK